MPKATYFRLAKDKQQRIIAAGIEELSSTSFDAFSIQKVIQQAEIPRGSFYQYFSDKQDLVGLLGYEIGRVKLDLMQSYLMEKFQCSAGEIKQKLFCMDFQKSLYTIIKSALIFLEKHPNYIDCIKNIYASKNLDKKKLARSYENILAMQAEKPFIDNSIFMELIQQAAGKGEIAPNVDLNLLHYMIQQGSEWLLDYLRNSQMEWSTENLQKIFQKYYDMIFHGILGE